MSEWSSISLLSSINNPLYIRASVPHLSRVERHSRFCLGPNSNMAKPTGTTSARDHGPGAGTPSDNNKNPNIMKRVSLFTRIRFFFKAWAMKISLASMFKLMRITGAAKLKPLLPEYTKRYPERPMLQHRVFLPGKQSENGELPPLLISIHGGVGSFHFLACPLLRKSQYSQYRAS